MRDPVCESIVIAMPGFLVSCVTLSLLLAGSCAKQSPTARETIEPPWSLQLTTSGGLTGLGRGNLSVNNEGKFSCSQTNRQDVRKGVEGTLNPRQLQPISDAVAKVSPKEWNKPGLNVAAPDAYGYKLELRMGTDVKVFTVQWYDNTSDQLPEDLKKLSQVLMQAMNASCGGTP